jgi:tRNA (guanine37-N1)-methyltransferase
MRIDILTIFPEIFSPFLQTSVLRRAQEEKIVQIRLTNIRDFATDRHRTVDDHPYGGGPGMIMKIEPIYRALSSLRLVGKARPPASKVILLSARGKQFTQTTARRFSKLSRLALICGRYEGVDQRVADHLVDEEISIGPYVLAGGEVAAMAIVEAVVRLLPGVLGNPASLGEESFSRITTDQALLEYPQYTKPAEFRGWKVPAVLLSGNHDKIRKWRERHRKTVKLAR